jgi:hypothetical protein
VNLRRPVLLALVALVGLSACASTPSARRVALDVVESLDVPDDVKECMRDSIEAYDQDELQDIAEQADAGLAEGTAAMSRFEADLAACNR